MFKKLEEKLNMLNRVIKDTKWTFKDEKLQCLRKYIQIYIVVGFNSRLDIAEKINEPVNRNRKYPMGNTHTHTKTKKQKQSINVEQLQVS